MTPAAPTARPPAPVVPESTTAPAGIREVSALTGLSPDTLRWYEREGLLPPVDRTSDGRRMFSPAAVRFIRLVQVLRRTGMPVAEVRAFVQLGRGTLAAHPVRLAMLERQAAAIERHAAQLQDDMAVVRAKTEHYRHLIARGLDCEDEIDPVEDDERAPERPAVGAGP